MVFGFAFIRCYDKQRTLSLHLTRKKGNLPSVFKWTPTIFKLELKSF